MSKEFDLSKRIQGNGKWGVEEWLKIKDVKELIKLLKEELVYVLDGRTHCEKCRSHAIQEQHDIINKRAGKNLTSEDEN